MSKRKSSRAADVEAKKAKLAEELALKFDCEWTSEGDGGVLVRYSKSQPGQEKVASFDIDWTLTGTQSGRKFTTGANDWQWLYDCVPDKLKSLHKEGYRIVFFTNQAGIEKNKTTPQAVMDRVDGMCRDLDIPVFCFACAGTNQYRKPFTGMWDTFEESYNQGVTVDRTCSLYVGDAAGRAKAWAKDKPKDFSCSDRMFAANVGIDFYTPEEYFLGEKKAVFEWRTNDPSNYLTGAESNTMKGSYNSKTSELVIMVGPPASGKSTFCRRYLQPHGYTVVNRDTLGTNAKCIKAVKEALGKGVSAVVDNTCPSVAGRADFTSLADSAAVPCRCFVMVTPFDLAHHMNMFRMNRSKGRVRRVPDVGYNVYKKNYQLPTKEEGFTEILKIPFVPKFDNERDRNMFKQWTDS